jgi:hypothetical protein
VIPFLVLLVFGIIEFGAAWRAYQIVTNTAREGARAAVLPSSTYAGPMAVVNGHLSGGGLDPADATVEILCTAGTDATCFPASTGEGTEVRISYPYTFIFLGPIVNYIGWSGSGFGTVTMQTGIVMRNE